MTIKRVNAIDGNEPVGAYVQAVQVRDTTLGLYLSGQTPVSRDGKVPDWSSIFSLVARRIGIR